MLLLLSVMLATLSAGQPGAKQKTVRSAQTLFGPEIQLPQLFEVNKFYVLRLQFSSDGRLEQAAVQPKYFFRDIRPDWEEPKDFEFLSKQQYTDVIARLEALRPKGALVRHADSPYVTNLTFFRKDEYENRGARVGRTHGPSSSLGSAGARSVDTTEVHKATLRKGGLTARSGWRASPFHPGGAATPRPTPRGRSRGRP